MRRTSKSCRSSAASTPAGEPPPPPRSPGLPPAAPPAGRRRRERGGWWTRREPWGPGWRRGRSTVLPGLLQPNSVEERRDLDLDRSREHVRKRRRPPPEHVTVPEHEGLGGPFVTHANLVGLGIDEPHRFHAHSEIGVRL